METSEFLMSIGQVLMWLSLVVMVFNLLVLWLARRIEARLTEKLGEIAQDLEAEKLIALTVEVDGDQFLCYNAQTMSFVCQGRNLEEIRERFRQRYPQKSAAIYNGDESAVKTLKQQLKELNENSRSIGSAS
jgi:heme/copper-type cytochrome/quinol oxidase subunit 1